jgi:hypothetical protein
VREVRLHVGVCCWYSGFALIPSSTTEHKLDMKTTHFGRLDVGGVLVSSFLGFFGASGADGAGGTWQCLKISIIITSCIMWTSKDKH